MKRTIMIAFLIAPVLALTVYFALEPADAAKPAGNTPATTTLADIDATTGMVYRIGSDSLGPYQNSIDRVESIIQPNGDWELNGLDANVRRVRLDFGDPVIGTGANPPFQSAFVPTRFISKCAEVGIFMPGLANGQQVDCPLYLRFNYNNVEYVLRAGAAYPGTQLVTWTCLARNSTKCVSWTMIPSVVQADDQRKIAMQLLKPKTRPRDPDISLGQFYMSFSLSVTTP
jgi:hypothetical protein